MILFGEIIWFSSVGTRMGAALLEDWWRGLCLLLPLRTRPYFLGHQLLHRSVCGFFSLTSAPKSPVKMAVSFCLDWQLTWHGLYADLVSEHIALPFPVFLIKFLWGEKEKNLRFAEDLLCGQSHKYRCYWVHKTGSQDRVGHLHLLGWRLPGSQYPKEA